MRKFISSQPLLTLVSILAICIISILTINACRKMDRSVEGHVIADIGARFFDQHASSSPEVQAIASLLKRENNKNPFVERLVKKAGFPWWDKAIILTKNTTSSQSRVMGGDSASTVVFIPFAKDTQRVVSAALRVTMTPRGDTIVKVLYASKYYDSVATGMSPRHLSLLLMTLDNAVFGHKTFHVTDSTAFGGLGKKANYVQINPDPSVPISGRLVEYTLTVCYTVTYPGYCDGQVHGVAPGEDPYCSEYLCESVSWWEDDGSGGGSGGGGWPPSGGGGGGGSTGGDQNPCRAIPGDADPCAGGSGSGGWVPIEDEGGVPPYIINNLQNRCLKNVLRKLTTSSNTTLFNQIYNVFDTAANLHMSFNEAGLDTAYGLCAWYDSSSIGPFADITMDTINLLNCSQEWMGYVFIHEIAHAGMFANIIQWDTANTQHSEMISHYLTLMANSLTSAFPGLSLYDAYAMCYAGFNNGLDGSTVGDAALMYILLKEVKKKLTNYSITAQQLIDKGEEYVETGTSGTRLNCH